MSNARSILILSCLAALPLGCDRQYRVRYVTADAKIQDRLYVVALDRSGEAIRSVDGVVTIGFGPDRIAKVNTFKYFEQGHASEFVSRDRTDSIAMGFGEAAPGSR